MKKILFVVMLTISSMLSFAGVIMTSSNERLEDVTITSETDSAIVYMQDGVEKSIAIEQVSAILYDNGHFVEFNQSTTSNSPNSFNENNTTHLISNSIDNKEMLKMSFNPSIMKIASQPAYLKVISDPTLKYYVHSIMIKAHKESELVLKVELEKGTPKKIAKRTAKHVCDSILNEITEIYGKNSISNK